MCKVVKDSSLSVGTFEGGTEEDLETDCGGLNGTSLRTEDGDGLDFDSCST